MCIYKKYLSSRILCDIASSQISASKLSFPNYFPFLYFCTIIDSLHFVIVENDMARLKDDKETGRSVNREDADSNGPMARKIVASPDIHPVANHISTSPPHDGLLIKQEFVYTPSTSPPTEESYSIMDQDDALSRSTTPSVATTASHDDVVDENGVLDLSVQKTYNKATIQKPTSLPLLVAGNDAESVPKDPKTREALDALVMMQTSSAASTFDGQSFVSPSSEDGWETAGHCHLYSVVVHIDFQIYQFGVLKKA